MGTVDQPVLGDPMPRNQRAVTRALLIRTPMSAMQKRYWYLSALSSGAGAANLCIVRRLTGNIDKRLLQHSVDSVVDRHASLRTTFDTSGHEPMQQIWRQAVVPVRWLERGECADSDIGERIRCEADHVFDLAEGPLFRVTVIGKDTGEYILVCTFHHIVCDGMSARVFLNDLLRAYTALAQTGSLPQRPPAAQYFALADTRHGSPPRLSEQFWKAELDEAPRLTSFPVDHPRPSIMRHRGAVQRVRVSLEDAAALSQFARSTNCTEFMVLMTFLAVLLHRFTGQTDLVMGTTLSGRESPESYSAIGCFANLVPIRMACTPDSSLTDLLAHARGKVLLALTHGTVPFERVLELARPPRSASHTPLFQVLLTYHSTKREVSGRGPRPPMTSEPFFANRTTSRFDFSLDVYPTQRSGIDIVAEYDTDLFDAGTIDSILSCLRYLIATAKDGRTEPVAKLPLFSPAHAAAMAAAAGPCARPIPRHAMPLDMFRDLAAQYPHEIAARHEGRDLRYETLARESDNVAARLIAAGLKPGGRAAILIEPSFPFLFAVLGVLKAGASYLPLNPAHPWPRNQQILSDAAPDVLVVTAAESPTSAAPVPTIVLDRSLDAGELAGRPDLPPVPAPQAPIYTIYTSGSTGQPKGVTVSHASVANLVAHFREAFGIDRNDVLLGVTPASFDLGNFDVLLCLSTGARLVIAPPGTLANPESLHALARAERVSVMHATPSAYRFYLAGQPTGHTRSHRLRLALCGGEHYEMALGQALTEVATEVWNLYGPTEATVWATAQRVEPGKRIDLGRPVRNTQAYVLDPLNRPCPQGAIGELALGGAGLAREYLNRPQLTAEQFMDVSLGGSAHRLYLTGDRARQRADTTLEFLGRADSQVKIRGYRVEPAEVEQALAQHPSIAAAAVTVADSGDTAGSQLIGFIVPRAGDAATLDLSAIREALRAGIPDYMVPARLFAVEHLPVTVNGKVDRAALPLIERPTDQEHQPAHAHGTTEATLAAIWSAVLGVDSIKPTDNFFALGGHSLAALEVMLQAERSGLRVTPAEVLACRSLRELAIVARELAVPPPSHARDTAPLALARNHAYQVFYLSAKDTAETTRTVLTIPAEIREERLYQVMRTLEAHHPLLACCYAFADGCYGCILKPGKTRARIAWRETSNVMGPTGDERQPLPARYLHDTGLYHLAAVVDPVRRMTRLILRTEVFSFDQRSLRLIRAQLFGLLVGAATQPETLAPAPATDYWTYAAQRDLDWQQRESGSLPYWTEKAALTDWRPLRDPLATRPARFSFAGSRCTIGFRAFTRSRLAALCERYRCSEANLLCASAVYAMHRCGTDTARLPIQLVNDGLEQADASAIVGPLAYGYYIVASLGENPSPTAFLANMIEEWTAALAHSRVFMRTIWKPVKPPENKAYEGRLPVTYLHNAALARAGVGPDSEPITIGAPTRTHVDRELTITTYLGAGYLQLALKLYETCLFALDARAFARGVAEFLYRLERPDEA